MALVIYKEARGEPGLGKVAVGTVLLNRAESNNVSPCEELRLRGNQWSWDKSKNTLSLIKQESSAWQDSLKFAQISIDWKQSGNSLFSIDHFHANHIKPSWASKGKKVFTIGNHTFYNLV